MSEFASMLASFKQNAAASSSSSQRPSSSSTRSAPSSTQKQQPRKRQHPNSTIRSQPHFPSMHYDYNSRKHKKGGSEFELSFLVIGAQKAGTSWLHKMLQKCEHLSLPVDQKEVHFWDWHYKKGIDWYIRQFDFPPKKLKSTHKTDADEKSSSTDNNPLYGEITPCYAVLNPSTIGEIRKCFPNLKLIFVARDLVDRAWSAMIMELRDQTMGLNAGEFAKGAGVLGGNQGSSKRAKAGEITISVAQQRRLQQQSSPSSQPDSYYLDRLRSETHTSRSDYATHLMNWYSHYPSENVLIVDYRDIETNPRDVLLKIVVHIGVDEKEAKAYVEKLSDEDVKQRVNVATNASTENGGSNPFEKKSAAPTSHHSLSERPRLRRQMEAYMHPYATKFNSLLKEKGYSWTVDEYNR